MCNVLCFFVCGIAGYIYGNFVNLINCPPLKLTFKRGLLLLKIDLILLASWALPQS